MSGIDPARLRRIDARLGRYVDEGQLAGWHVVVSRDGETVHDSLRGRRDVEADLPVEHDTLWRIYSMTKPITSLAALMLWEEGAFELRDPVATWIPSFADSRVWAGGTAPKPVTQPLLEPVRIWHLLTHTAGLTYGFHHVHPVDRRYREAGYEWGTPPGTTLAEAVDFWASEPLLFQPGAEWNYSVATDVVGRLVEVVSGQTLDRFLQERIFDPLGMTETAFSVNEAQLHRLAALYVPAPGTGALVRHDAMGDAVKSPPSAPSGGGGLVSTAADYARFVALLANEGELDGVRLLGSRTVRMMAANHLPGGADLETFGRQLFAEVPFTGVGFGLGVAPVLDPIAGKTAGSVGEYSWGGAASTAFWVDPAERLTAMLLTQLLPSSTYPLRSQLRQLVYQALVD